jgi:hypothetical protein
MSETGFVDVWYEEYVQSFYLDLEADHTYAAQVKLTVQTTCSDPSLGSGQADFTDGDDGDEYVDVGYIDITF